MNFNGKTEQIRVVTLGNLVFIVLSNVITVNVRFKFNILIFCDAGEDCELMAAKICNEKKKSQVMNEKECRFTRLH